MNREEVKFCIVALFDIKSADVLLALSESLLLIVQSRNNFRFSLVLSIRVSRDLSQVVMVVSSANRVK